MNTNDLKALHVAYCKATGFEIQWDIGREMLWLGVWRQGIKPDDIPLLVNHYTKEIKAERRNPGCLKLRNFAGSPDYLEEDLAALKAKQRATENAFAPDKSYAMRATARPDRREAPPSRTVGEIISKEQLAEKFAEFRRKHA